MDMQITVKETFYVSDSHGRFSVKLERNSLHLPSDTAPVCLLFAHLNFNIV